MKKEKPLSPEEIKINQAFKKAIANRKFSVPSAALLTTYELMSPEMKAILHAAPKRKQIDKTEADKWYVKLTAKLDRLDFPELTQGKDKLTEAKKLGRRMAIYRDTCSPEILAGLKKTTFNQKLTSRIMGAVWNFDADFLIDYANALTATSGRAALYRFMLSRAAEIDALKKVAHIYALTKSAGVAIERGSFYTLCREIGLPTVKG